MKNWHTEKFIVNDTNVDMNGEVSIEELIRFFQIATFNHSNLIGLDHKSMIQNSNAFWVVTKIKVELKNSIRVGDKLNVTTWTHEVGGVRALRDCAMKVGNRVMAKATSEWVCLDYESRRLRKMNSIQYPELEMQKTCNLNTEFTNLKSDVTEKDYVYSRVIKSSDIDINNHVNNLKYNFMAIDAFSVNDLSNKVIKEYEIYFVNETYEQDEIKVFKKKVGKYYYIEGRSQDKVVFRTIVKFAKK